MNQYPALDIAEREALKYLTDVVTGQVKSVPTRMRAAQWILKRAERAKVTCEPIPSGAKRSDASPRGSSEPTPE